MSDITRCPKCFSLVRCGVHHCPMCGADMPPQRQFGMETETIPPPPPTPQAAPPATVKRAPSTGPIIAAGCVIALAVIGTILFFTVRKFFAHPENLINKAIEQPVRDTAAKFFKLLDAGDFENAWAMGDNAFHSSTTFREFNDYMHAQHAHFGPRIKPVIKAYKKSTNSMNGKTTVTHTLTFKTEFEKREADETLVLIETHGKIFVHAYKGPDAPVANRKPHRPGGRSPHAAPLEPDTEPQDGTPDVDAAAEAFMSLLDAEDYDAAWDMCAPEFQEAMGRDRFDSLMRDIAEKHGARKDRRSIGYSSSSVFANGVNSVTYSITYRTTFETGDAVEEVVLGGGENGLAVTYYTILSESVQMPEIDRPAPFHHGEREHPPAEPRIPRRGGLEI